ncbi:hypothetical protein [Haliangium ochraceum]|nr:hypothetical protein [Haliangium ochraceum]
MTTSHHAALQRALSIRLNLQISLSALPIVEEWMDIHLTRWLESVPSPPEMPSGHNAHFSVRLASDLSRLTWGAYGNPAGFIPKMDGYLRKSGISQTDIALIDEMGNGLEPALVGTWIAVRDNAITTGWQFCDEHEFARIAPLFAEREGKTKLMAWLAEIGVERFCGFVQTIGEAPASTIEFPMPGVAIDDRLAAADQAFMMMAGEPLPAPVREAMADAANTNVVVGVSMTGGEIAAVSVSAPGIANDVVAKLCGDLKLGFDDKHPRLQAALGAESADRVEYRRVLGEGASHEVDVLVVPTGADLRARDASN